MSAYKGVKMTMLEFQGLTSALAAIRKNPAFPHMDKAVKLEYLTDTVMKALSVKLYPVRKALAPKDSLKPDEVQSKANVIKTSLSGAEIYVEVLDSDTVRTDWAVIDSGLCDFFTGSPWKKPEWSAEDFKK